MMGGGMGMGMAGFGLLGMLLFWVILIGVIVLVVRAFMGADKRPYGATTAQTPLEILQARYARGEINREEYIEMKDALVQ